VSNVTSILYLAFEGHDILGKCSKELGIFLMEFIWGRRLKWLLLKAGRIGLENAILLPLLLILLFASRESVPLFSIFQLQSLLPV
jgi:hypothetical protein